MFGEKFSGILLLGSHGNHGAMRSLERLWGAPSNLLLMCLQSAGENSPNNPHSAGHAASAKSAPVSLPTLARAASLPCVLRSCPRRSRRRSWNKRICRTATGVPKSWHMAPRYLGKVANRGPETVGLGNLVSQGSNSQVVRAATGEWSQQSQHLLRKQTHVGAIIQT
eukprot:5024349-Pleurochrysis_carterae.AAC.3